MTTKEALENLRSETCRCGRWKFPKNVFCRRCYRSLPSEMRQALYRKIGDGHEEAVSAAVEFLEGEKPKRQIETRLTF